MPGLNCAVLGCDTSRRTKGIDIFKLLAAKNDEYKKWREERLSEITKTRVIYKVFRGETLNDAVYICEKHLKAENIELCKYTQLLNFVTLSLSFVTVFASLLGLNNHQHI